MTKQFKTLREGMSPEAQKRAAERTEKILAAGHIVNHTHHPIRQACERSGTCMPAYNEVLRLERENVVLRYVVEKAAEWGPENTDNADLSALGAYARAALQQHPAGGGAPKCARCGHTWPEHEATASNILCPDESAKDSGSTI